MSQLSIITIILFFFPLVCTFNIKTSNSLHNVHNSNRFLKMEVFEGNPIGKAAWDTLWNLDFMKPSEQGVSPTSFGDAANVLRTNIEQIYGDEPSYDGAPVAEGEVEGILEGSLFLALQTYYQRYGGVFKLLFGPKSFIVVSDPAICKYILRDNAVGYDKGVLAEILEPIMGKGLIPADPITWKARRRAIVPGFHKKWLQAMCNTFVKCNNPLVSKMQQAVDSGNTLNMETEFCSVSLDIIGKAVFNYEFGSVTNESPVIQSVYSALKEAEHRSITPLPYWNIPFANQLVPRLRKFNSDLKILDGVLNELIAKALETQEDIDEEDLQNRDYDNMENPSLLRFLVDMRGEEASSTQLRDDLMTMLIAGHETTAAVLTWTMYELSQNDKLLSQVRAEIDEVLGDRDPTYEDMLRLKLVRLCLAETLRMYPEPPLLIRRALSDDVFPAGGAGHKTIIPRGTDVFISTWNMHRSPDFWEDPDTYNPHRFLKEFKNPEQTNWAGYTPAENRLYPNEVHSDFAFMPFGGGTRKCVGDQFAMMESIATLCLILKRFDLKLESHPNEVGMRTGATIHTENGLPMRITRRKV